MKTNKDKPLLDFRIVVKEVNRIPYYRIAWTARVPKKVALSFINLALKKFIRAKYDEVINE